MSELAHLKAAPLAPTDHVVKALKELLAKAEAGELTSLLAVAEATGGDLVYAWSTGEDVCFTRLLGGIEHVKHKVLHRLLEQLEAGA